MKMDSETEVRIICKERAAKKWSKIVKDLMSKRPKFDWEITYSDCGYCQAYDVDADDQFGCADCPLNKHELCGTGDGEITRAMSAVLRAGSRNRQDIAYAREMLTAIEDDIASEKCGATKGPSEVATLKAKILALEATAAQAANCIESMEWKASFPGDGERRCLWCGRKMKYGHMAECAFRRALGILQSITEYSKNAN
jgi:hypothetical protein